MIKTASISMAHGEKLDRPEVTKGQVDKAM
jgi:hypothetical protein